MEVSKEEAMRRYMQAEKKLEKKDYVGTLIYVPYDPQDKYFYYLDKENRAIILDQLNQEFDCQEKLSVNKRSLTLDIQFQKDAEPIPTRIFARVAKGK